MGSVEGTPFLANTVFDEQERLQETLRLAEEGLIDPVDNMKEDNIYLFHGIHDSIVPWGRLVLSFLYLS